MSRSSIFSTRPATSNRPGLADGFYWGVRYATLAGDEWKLDLWFWPHGAMAHDVEYADELRPLTPETSVDIYDAVLDQRARTPEAFGCAGYVVHLT